jgi:hypothetical protein
VLNLLLFYKDHCILHALIALFHNDNCKLRGLIALFDHIFHGLIALFYNDDYCTLLECPRYNENKTNHSIKNGPLPAHVVEEIKGITIVSFSPS